MPELKVGDSFPAGVAFGHIKPDDSDITSCGIPIQLDVSEVAKNKKIIIVSVPGAFTPTCSVTHLPSYLDNVSELKAKGVDQVIVIAYNDPFVMSAWGKANKVKGDFIIFASDTETKFSQSIGWTAGERTARYAIAVDHGKVVYAAKEPARGVEVSGADAVLPKL